MHNCNKNKEGTHAPYPEPGNSARLAILRYLLKKGPEGAPVGRIQKEIGIPASTLSHHVSRLVSVGLLRQVCKSRLLHCPPQFEVLDALIAFLAAECCTEVDCCVDAPIKRDFLSQS
jgi:DNA-binding transcriptional ArsR family regulator